MQTDIIDPVKQGRSTSALIEMDQLPGPGGVPIFGNLFQLSPEKFHRIIEKWSNQYGSVFRIKFGNVPVIVFTSAASIQLILKNRPEKLRRMTKMDTIIREVGIFGVFNAEGEDWKRQRKLVSQALNLVHLKTFFPTLVGITEKLLNRWNDFSVANSSVDIKGELMRYTVDITSRLAFGYNMNTIDEKNDIIQNHLEVIFPAIFKRINSPLPYWRYVQLPADRKLKKSLAVIQKTMREIVQKTRTDMALHPELKTHPANFLQSLIAGIDPANAMSNQVIIGNVLSMLLAGEDTTAHTLSWVFYFMHCNPQVQLKMQQEADLVLGNDKVVKNYEDAAKLPYIEAVAFEAMRLKPVGPIMFHDTLEDIIIEGIKIPKGTGILLQTQYAALQQENFSSPEKFIPERWIVGGCPALKIHNDQAFVPFGAGPRFCPGYNLAMLEIKAILAMVCKNFEIHMETSPEKVHEVLAFTMMPSRFFIRFNKRKKLDETAASYPVANHLNLNGDAK